MIVRYIRGASIAFVWLACVFALTCCASIPGTASYKYKSKAARLSDKDLVDRYWGLQAALKSSDQEIGHNRMTQPFGRDTESEGTTKHMYNRKNTLYDKLRIISKELKRRGIDPKETTMRK